MHLTFTMSNTGGAERRIRMAASAATSTEGKEAAGGGLRECVVDHLRRLGPNKQFPSASTSFYQQAAESVTAPRATDEGAVVSITQLGMRQRYLGGHIQQNTPGKTYLTIPAQGFAYGRLAGEFTGDLKFAYVRNEEGYLCPALVAGEGGAGVSGMKLPRRRKGQPAKPPIAPNQVIFWLVRSVNQNPDPTVLPTPEELRTAVAGALTSFMRQAVADPNAAVHFAEGN